MRIPIARGDHKERLRIDRFLLRMGEKMGVVQKEGKIYHQRRRGD
jgi:hypothetical protein